MVVVVRFVNDKGNVIERFLGIEHVSDTTSHSLKEALDTMLRRYGLSISKIRGQGYDGASNMKGQFHGLQRLVLENVSEDGTDGEKKTIASGLITKIESFEFMFILHLMIRVLGLTQEISQCLQRKNQNIVRAIGLIGSVMRNMNAMRENGWDELFEEVKSFCVQKKIDIPNMEDMIPVRGRSKFRGAKLVTHYHHFHHGIFIVVIDQILCELNNRFPERSTQLLRCVACLDPNGSFANFEIEQLVELAKIYKDDFSDYDCEKLRGDLLVFIDDVKHDRDFGTCTDLGNLAEKMVQSDRHTHFSLVYRLIELALILPVATATVERAFSAMNIIKTERRNKMNDEWMNNSMICYIERDLFASVEDDKILKRFQGFKNRKINLPRERPSAHLESRLEQKRPRIELDLRDIVDDPGNRKPIDEFHHGIRDEARRAYLQKGPYRPTGHKFPKTKVNGRRRSRERECVGVPLLLPKLNAGWRWEWADTGTAM
ncbi:unnamed protein product [Miscanthus lutarioriparius]|uniref:HAT C-terminal dimerisation domain-containing protein n=1 Tax=Miscanthus lutarioriparius TaxID=422564 RepID=A0A811NE35_9POAL|nr:unnamed protein product [Miscanthus lutarioriparius]